MDAHKLCGLNASGYAAQAKFHTRNFVGPSGKIYLGTKQGYAKKGDTSKYPGGYFVVYDPRIGEAHNLGIPFPEQGIADVVADEARLRLASALAANGKTDQARTLLTTLRDARHADGLSDLARLWLLQITPRS